MQIKKIRFQVNGDNGAFILEMGMCDFMAWGLPKWINRALGGNLSTLDILARWQEGERAIQMPRPLYLPLAVIYNCETVEEVKKQKAA